MTPSPILKVLSSMQTNGVHCLLMGGQACVLYGGAEFSRDVDLAIAVDEQNLDRFQHALRELEADRIAVPPFSAEYLDRGLAIHFRCRHPDAARLRIDIMSKMRGVAEFSDLWLRRTTIETPQGPVDLLSLPDLVAAKKTQRDKDWVMLKRLVEANYFQHCDNPTVEQISFWLKELRDPALLIQVAVGHGDLARELQSERPLLVHALRSDEPMTDSALNDEERREREADRLYWKPLREELERLRRGTR